MAYAQDTIISANAANDYALVLQGLLTDAGWTMVDSGTPSGSYRFQAWKSDGGDNLCGYDWYLTIQWNSVGTEQTVDIIAGGAYNVGTHALSQIAVPDGTSIAYTTSLSLNYADPTTGDHFGAKAVNLATVAANTTNSFPRGTTSSVIVKPWHSIIVPSSAFGYWMSVTLDHVGIYTTIPNTFVAHTLAVDPDYLAVGFGVAPNPIASIYANGVPSALALGFSASMLGTGTTATNFLAPNTLSNPAYGVPLPILDGNYLDAYAWRSRRYLGTIPSGPSFGGSNVPPWDLPRFGFGIPIGDAIDLYMVNGGSLGDTVEIDSATYVLSGSTLGLGSVALLVE